MYICVIISLNKYVKTASTYSTYINVYVNNLINGV